MANYLVTGGGGFIGSHLVEHLLKAGHRVRIFDNFSTGRTSNVDAVRPAGPDRLQVVTGDVRDLDAVREAAGDMRGIFHLAALGSVPRSVENPRESNAVNTDGTLNVLWAARERGVGRVVFAGSSSVYGALDATPKREDHPTKPVSPYGLTKLIGEEYLRLFREIYGLETVTVRYYNVFGPRQSPHSQYAAVIPSFIHRILRNEPAIVHGDGDQSRDFTYVANAVEGTVMAMEAPADSVAYGVFNIAAGGRHSLNDLLRELAVILEKTPRVEHTPPRAGDIKHSQADIERARRAFGYEPRVSFKEGLQQTVEYFRSGAESA
jgi:UDP-N-acetylglucosamine/UDP-N-acetyl-alpha-D-glucosaminouronate 4-epimerase